ncbi:MAG: hypothetical protein R3C59_16515 [Planctomycetaceae bacterium]
MTVPYQHTQRAPLCLLVYALAITFMVLGVVLQDVPPIRWLYPPLSLLMLVLAASFHQLTVRDDGGRLSISFGPIPLFRRSVRYKDIKAAEVGRTTLLDGWGIHYSIRGGWVWNLWGRDCAVVHFKNGGKLWIGTDDAENLSGFLNNRIVGEKS